MPTLVHVNTSPSNEENSIDSETLLYDESVVNQGDDDIRSGGRARSPRSSPVLARVGIGNDTDKSGVDISVMFDHDEDEGLDEFPSPSNEEILRRAPEMDLSMTILSDSPLKQRLNYAPPTSNPAIPKTRIARPNEVLYRAKYQSYVEQTVQDFKNRHSGKLREYKLMSAEEKEAEQINLMDLLNRLKLNTLSSPLQLSKENNITAATHGDQKEATSSVSHVTHFVQGDEASDITPEAYGLRDGATSVMPSINFDQFSADRSGIGSSNTGSSQVVGGISAQMTTKSNFHPPESSHGSTNLSRNTQDAFSQHSGLGGERARSQCSGLGTERAPSISMSKNAVPSSTRCGMAVEPVEKARGYGSVSSRSSSYSSPERRKSLSGHKRNASMSGKRGADSSRHRSNDASPSLLSSPIYGNGFIDIEDDDDLHPFTQSGAVHIPPSPPGENQTIFQASQSPIAHRFTPYVDSPGDKSSQDSVVYMAWSKETSIYSESSIAMEGSRGMEMDTITTLETDQSGRTDRHHLRKLTSDLNMRDDAIFHLEKLAIRYSELELLKERSRPDHRRRRLVDFPDSLRTYPERAQKRLNYIAKWIHKREVRASSSESWNGTDDQKSTPKGAIFSLSYGQIIDVTIKIMNAFRPDESTLRRSAKIIEGKTIVVARSKEDLVDWEHALREKSDFSVINHATLKREDRKRAPMAKKCSMYDVVLTTYDALKASDVAVPIDESGHAITKKIRESDGWYSSRSGAQCSTESSSANPQNCKQFSILHKIRFRRIIFIDALGRGSYLLKSGTARSMASIALHGDSRFAFFERDEGSDVPTITSFTRSDKKASSSVGLALRIGEDCCTEDFFEFYGVDYKRIKSSKIDTSGNE